MTHQKTVSELADQTEQQLRQGFFGRSGDVFLPLRDFARQSSVSYVTAQRAAVLLQQRGLLTLRNNRLYITRGPLYRNSVLYRLRQQDAPVSRSIGMYLRKIDNQFFTGIARRLSDRLNAHGYTLVLLTGRGADQEAAALRQFLQLGVRAVISCPGLSPEVGALYRDYILPLVFIGRCPEGCAQQTVVLVDNYDAGHQVALHLLAGDCRSFAYIGPSQLRREEDLRRAGFVEGLQENGVLLPAEQQFTAGGEEGMHLGMQLRQFLSRCEKPLGLFCYHDLLAVQILSYCHRAGLSVPQQVRLVGFDDLEVCQAVTPALSSVYYRFDRIAEAAADRALSLIQDPETARERVLIGQSLIVRRSSSPQAEE
mgnify:FL=1